MLQGCSSSWRITLRWLAGMIDPVEAHYMYVQVDLPRGVGRPSTTMRRPFKPGAGGRRPLRRRSYRQTAPGRALLSKHAVISSGKPLQHFFSTSDAPVLGQPAPLSLMTLRKATLLDSLTCFGN